MIVEIRTSDETLIERRRIATLPITIGRGFHNDIVVDDRYVCPEHLRIEAHDGHLALVSDQKSLNGSYLLPHETPVSSSPVTGATTFRIGETLVSLYDEKHEPAPTILHPRNRQAKLPISERFSLALILFVVYVGAASFAQSLLTHTPGPQPQVARLFVYYAAFVGGLSIFWAGIWALATKLFRKQLHYSAHVNAMLWWFIVGLPLSFFSSWFEFIANQSSVSQTVSYLVSFVWFSGWLYQHLKVVQPERSGWSVFRRAALLPAAGLLLFAGYSHYDMSHNNSELPLISKTLPPSLQLTSSESIDQFIADADSLKAELAE